jgi:hypothetical protein
MFVCMYVIMFTVYVLTFYIFCIFTQQDVNNKDNVITQVRVTIATKLWSFITSHEHKLCGRSRTSHHPFVSGTVSIY